VSHCKCVLVAVITMAGNREVEGASLICHFMQGVSLEGVSSKGVSFKFATVLIVGFISFISFVCQGPGNTCNN
jgi:hypothetical protein